MTKKILFIVFNLWVVTTFAGDSLTTNTTIDSSFSVMSGVFTVGEDSRVPKNGKIVVKYANTKEIVGIYRPNKKTGKYLFILPPGKIYQIRYEVEGSLFKSENLIVPVSTSYKRINKKINLGKVD